MCPSPFPPSAWRHRKRCAPGATREGITAGDLALCYLIVFSSRQKRRDIWLADTPTVLLPNVTLTSISPFCER